jgi:hypothetical protein
MITDVPKPEDFFAAGWKFLDYAWSDAMGLLLDLQLYTKDNQCNQAEVEEFWSSGKSKLATSLALTQQGIELLLKGCISEVSPYLLISEPKGYPAGSSREDTPFSRFRTIDSQDLVKVYDTVKKKRLSKEFKGKFEALRKHRNIVFHSVSESISVQVPEVLSAIFEAVENLNPGTKWMKVHKGLY